MSQPIIKLQNVSKVFDVKTQDILVLKNINLELNEGEFIIVFGPSGSGKSTLLNVMLGLEPVTTGTVVFGNIVLSDVTSEDQLADFRKHNVGIIYQQTNWIKSLNVVDNVGFALELFGIDKQSARAKALEMLELVGMKGWSNFYPSELSAGQQQKVALARALITDPKIVVADEPTGNLDYQSGLDLMRIFSDLQKSGKTIIMVTHNPENLAAATTIIQVFDGNVVQVINTLGQDMEKIKNDLIQKGGNVATKQTSKISLEDIKFMSATVKRKPRASSLIKVARRLSLLGLVRAVWQVVIFSIFMAINLLQSLFTGFFSLGIWGKGIHKAMVGFANKVYGIVVRPFNWTYSPESLSPLSLVELSVKNLLNKRTRSVVTIGGMALGIGFIVFLISIGYGLEGLVISRVATLKERKQIDVIPVVSGNLNINDDTLEQFSDLTGVEKVLPFISVAGTVSYQNSSSDVVAYGVLSDYLEEEDVTPSAGALFESNELFRSEEKEIVDVDPETDDVEVELSDQTRQAVINDSFMQILGLQLTDAIGKKFTVEFTVTGELIEGNMRIKSLPVEYEILGVTEDNRNPIMYIPILHTKELGITRYSQVKIITDTEANVATARNLIEFLGYRTVSVLDTVTQIEQLFSNVRILLVVIGGIALAVASLGMFNTLTVSLLERTREVGLMKAIGMKSNEVKTLFINESVIMGILGGVGGLFLGFLMGKALSALLSVVSVSRGYTAIDVAIIPSGIVAIIVTLSIVIGVITGIYPAVRATRISALNALRYE